jgi:hypothetical protein
MSKQQIIEAIRTRNRTARRDFLTEFDEHTLTSYLQRLTRIAGHRGRSSAWIRPADTTAVVTRMH